MINFSPLNFYIIVQSSLTPAQALYFLILLSDISFSSNDYTLNSLLTLLPRRIYIHIIDGIEDEFINTLKLIFDNRVCICNDCIWSIGVV